MPLSFVPENRDVVIKKIRTEDNVKAHLEDMGINIGSTLKVISQKGGAVIVSIRGGRLCLDRNLASAISVSL